MPTVRVEGLGGPLLLRVGLRLGPDPGPHAEESVLFALEGADKNGPGYARISARALEKD